MCRKSMLLLVGLLSLSVLLLTSAGCSVSVAPDGHAQFPQLSVAEERELGLQAYQQVVQEMGGVYPDRQLNRYLNRIGQGLAAESQHSQRVYRFELINDSVPNAFSLPGGFVAITRGLLLSLQTEAQLAAVLSCEIGHLIARHPLQGLRREALRGPAIDLLDDLSAEGDYADLVARLPGIGTELTNKRYRPEQELEADRIGIELMVAAGYLPTAAVEVQEYFLVQRDQAVEDNGLSSLSRSHPFSAERLESTRNYIAKRYAQRGGHSGASEFAAEVEALRQVAEGYAGYERARKLERLGQVAEAIATYHQALLIAPDEALILGGLGLAYLRNEDSVPARRYLAKALNLQGDNAQFRLGMGYVYLHKWQYAQAISQLEKSLQQLPTVEAVFLLAEAQQQIGHMVKARDLYLIVASADRVGKLGQLAETRLTQLKGT